MAQEGKAYVHAALALYYAGAQLNEDNLKKVVESLGIQADDARIKMLVASLSEINIEDVLKNASTVVSAPVAAPASAPIEEKKEEAKKEEEEKEESKEVDIGEGLSGLFGM